MFGNGRDGEDGINNSKEMRKGVGESVSERDENRSGMGKRGCERDKYGEEKVSEEGGRGVERCRR